MQKAQRTHYINTRMCKYIRITQNRNRNRQSPKVMLKYICIYFTCCLVIVGATVNVNLIVIVIVLKHSCGSMREKEGEEGRKTGWHGMRNRCRVQCISIEKVKQMGKEWVNATRIRTSRNMYCTCTCMSRRCA